MRYLEATGKLGERVKILLSKLIESTSQRGFEMDVRMVDESEYELAYVFITLGVFEEAEGKLILSSEFHDFYRKELMLKKEILSNKALEAILHAHKIIGKQAERIVIFHEQERLRKLGRNFEAEAVRQISLENAAAGYDIESFNGCEPAIEADRFIEVKGSRASELSFFLTKNEYNKARQLKEKYWLYFVSNIGSRSKSAILKIQNLFSFINKSKDTKFEPVCWHIVSNLRVLDSAAYGNKDLIRVYSKD